ncbi:hypothetical protein [Xanthomonas arboricola]|uniref:hypothetical protein n=1 Tax=Xanthomonas arboricola TaxID=56448 RepID=UPI0004D50D1C|nr:hypothetical protein [Xanthomonas arboricola]KER81304.1 hypothetical protein IA64_16165 [Xanthomonas arboricola pv. celebensis]
MDIAGELIKLGAVGLIAGLFSSLLANRDHRYRKWWELRVSAYQGAIEALSDIVYYFEKHYNAEVEYRELTEEFKEKISEFWNTSYPKVRRLADSGAFLFSDRANAALKEFMRDDDEQTYIEHLDNNLAKSKKCLKELVACSKIDLRLKEGVFFRWFP